MEPITLNSQQWQMAMQLFSPAVPTSETELFAGRTEQILCMLKAITERGKHVVLYGERGVGKTSLSGVVPHLLDKSLKAVCVKKQASPEDNYTSLWKKVFRDLSYSITTNAPGFNANERNIIKSLADHYPSNITSDDVVRELQKIPLGVIIFDEFDKIEDLETKKLMSHTLKLISDIGINSTIIIVGVADDIGKLVEAHQSITRNLEEIKMPRMSEAELKEILSKRLPKLHLEIEPKALQKVIELSRGLPEYVHALGRNSALEAINNNRKTITVQDVGSAIKIFLQQSRESSNIAFNTATHSNKTNARYIEVLLACALADADSDGRFTPAALIKPLSKILGKEVKIGSFQPLLDAFCTEERGFILEKLGMARAFKYRFREPKMQPYVIMYGMTSGRIEN